MFSGLIEEIGQLAALDKSADGVVLKVRHDAWDPPLRTGESIAVQGVCLTITTCERDKFACDVLDETLSRTNLASKRPGALLNLERALRPNDRLGGHFVAGHVDGIGVLRGRSKASGDWVLEVECGEELATGICEKGSIACDGVSLTVADVSRKSFATHIIPFTWEHTSLRALGVGDTLNLETDILEKYVCRYLETRNADSGVTLDDLRNAGFV